MCGCGVYDVFFAPPALLPPIFLTSHWPCFVVLTCAVQAFQASGMKLDAPATRIADVLAYHVVKGRHPIPRGFVSGQPVTTLQGQNITVTYKQ